MLSLLTKYLLQYRRLSIPHVGTFELVQQVPEFNVVDKLMMPPSFRLNWNHNDFLTEHQLSYLAASVQSDKQQVREELDSFGRKLRTRVQKEPLAWNGMGTLTNEAGSIIIDGNVLKIDGLEAVPAYRPIRQDAAHSMLVGDRQTTSHQMAHAMHKTGGKKVSIVLIGWILFILALLAIAFLLYKGGFNPLSSGLKMKAGGSGLY